MKPANHKENRRDRRVTTNQTGKRRCIMAIRQRDGVVVPSAFRTEGSALAYIRNHVAADAVPRTEPMSTEVNNARHNGAELLPPMREEAVGRTQRRAERGSKKT